MADEWQMPAGLLVIPSLFSPFSSHSLYFPADRLTSPNTKKKKSRAAFVAVSSPEVVLLLLLGLFGYIQRSRTHSDPLPKDKYVTFAYVVFYLERFLSIMIVLVLEFLDTSAVEI